MQPCTDHDQLETARDEKEEPSSTNDVNLHAAHAHALCDKYRLAHLDNYGTAGNDVPHFNSSARGALRDLP